MKNVKVNIYDYCCYYYYHYYNITIITAITYDLSLIGQYFQNYSMFGVISGNSLPVIHPTTSKY